VGEITAFEQQRLTRFFCKRIRKAVAEVQPCRMPTPFSEISVGVSGNLRLNCRDGFDGDVCFPDELVKTAASLWDRDWHRSQSQIQQN
jgi:hypothetical protein